MRLIIFLLLFPFALSAQFDKSDYKMPTDSTIVPAPDTMFYRFQEGVQTFVRPNGSKKDTPVYLATLIHRVNGIRHTGISSGQVQAREYLEWLINTREMENNDLARVLKDAEIRRARRDALNDEINRVRSR